MAKKKDKPQVINNIQELNLEIDYDKLANAIVRAQNQSSTIESYNEDGYEYVCKTLSGKTKRNYFSFSIGQFISWLFYVIAGGVVYLSVMFDSAIKEYYYNLSLAENHSVLFSKITSIAAAIVFFLISMLTFCILFNIAREIKKEKDRNYIISVFSGIVSFAALIVALVALIKGVG